VLGVGNGQVLSVSFTPSDTTDYTPATATAAIDVARATPAIDWSNPAAISYGTPLGGTQLDASASYLVGGTTVNVPGTFAYTPAAGTVLNGGINQALSVTFTPTDLSDFTTASGTAFINVTRARPSVTWHDPASVTYGTALSNPQLDATAGVPGTFVYTAPVGTVLSAGNNQTLSVTFTPTDTTDYTSTTATVTISVTRAGPTLTWNNPAAIIYGTALSTAQLDADAAYVVNGSTVTVPGVFVYQPACGDYPPGRQQTDPQRHVHAHGHDRLHRGHRRCLHQCEQGDSAGRLE